MGLIDKRVDKESRACGLTIVEPDVRSADGARSASAFIGFARGLTRALGSYNVFFQVEMSKGESARDRDATALRERAHVILATFDRVQPSPTWARFREATERARSLTDLRAINRELRGAMAGLPSAVRQELIQVLRDRFGPDTAAEQDRQAAEKALARGRIRSEREYRAVQAYADSIAGGRESEREYLALGALLDNFMMSPSSGSKSSSS